MKPDRCRQSRGGVSVEDVLSNRHRRTQTLNAPDLRSGNPRAVSAKRQRLDEPATCLRINHVERQRRLTRPRHANDSSQPRPEGHIDIAQIVLSRALYVEEPLAPAPRPLPRPIAPSPAIRRSTPPS